MPGGVQRTTDCGTQCSDLGHRVGICHRLGSMVSESFSNLINFEISGGTVCAPADAWGDLQRDCHGMRELLCHPSTLFIICRSETWRLCHFTRKKRVSVPCTAPRSRRCEAPGSLRHLLPSPEHVGWWQLTVFDDQKCQESKSWKSLLHLLLYLAVGVETFGSQFLLSLFLHQIPGVSDAHFYAFVEFCVFP